MTTNVDITRSGNESNMGIIRRFQRRVQESGVLMRVRSIRYAKRAESENTVRNAKLKHLDRKAKYEKLVKLGKIQPRS